MTTKNNPKDSAPKKADVLNTSEAIKTDASSIPTTKPESDKNLFQISDELTKKIKAQKIKCEEFDNQLKKLVARKEDIDMQLKPVPRFRGKSQSLPALSKLSAVERKTLREEKERIKNEVIKITDLLKRAEKKYSDLTGQSIKSLKLEQLKNKSNSKTYVGQNENMFRRILLKSLNTFVKDYKNSEVVEIQKIAKNNSEGGKKRFKEVFGSTLLEIDMHAYIMCSGLLSEKLFEAARLTLSKWNSRSKAEIEELIIPENQNATNIPKSSTKKGYK